MVHLMVLLTVYEMVHLMALSMGAELVMLSVYEMVHLMDSSMEAEWVTSTV